MDRDVKEKLKEVAEKIFPTTDKWQYDDPEFAHADIIQKQIDAEKVLTEFAVWIFENRRCKSDFQRSPP